MLQELRIRNFAIIDDLQISFSPGLNIMTGETGAGKSIIIGAMSLILGDRTSSEQIRSAEESAVVEALFDVSGNPEVRAKLDEMDIDYSDGIIIKRVNSRSGKNRTYINGSLSNIAYLSELAGYLVNVCGQHEHQLIMDPRNHIRYLDSFGGLDPEQGSFSQLYETYQDKRSRLCELENLQRNKASQEEFIRFQLREIEAANVAPGEDAALLDEKSIKSNARRLTELAGSSYESLYEGKESVLSGLSQVSAKLKEIQRIDRSFNVSPEEIDSITVTLEDLAITTRDYLKKLSFDPGRLEEIEDRLEQLKTLKRKYGGSLENVLDRKSSLERELAGIVSLDEELDKVKQEISVLKKELTDKALILSGKRKEAAAALQSSIEKEVRELRMADARFDIHFREPGEKGPELDQDGIDEIEFRISTNKGQKPKALDRIASGGELSRVMLALKKILAGTGRVDTLVFDEVDSGIGGAVAEVVGAKLAGLAKLHQVICITHLPQIACFGETHFLVSKADENDITTARVKMLTKAERLDEITRMMSGIEITKRAREYAREMLDAAKKI
ncbi:MAG: DNA repair protein RecN [Syntrophaceae bacterium]